MSPVQHPSDRLAAHLGLIVITDVALAAPRGVRGVVAAALAAGAPAVQLREKTLQPRDVLPLASRLRAETRAADALFLVNDRIDIALAVQADGVHLGPDDMPVAAARRIAPPGFVIGCSAATPARARAAIAAGADYIGCGPVFPTSTKEDAASPVGVAGLAAVVGAVRNPVVAIGGITAPRTPDVLRTGATGCAVVAAVMAAPDPGGAVRELLHLRRRAERSRSPQRAPRASDGSDG